MIDVHILTHGETQEQLDRCIASLDGQPVIIHVVQGIDEWPPENGRRLGYSKGSAEFVSYVDPDDWVEPNAFDRLLAAIDKSDAAYGWEWCHLPDGTKRIRKAPHHAIVFRRDVPVDLGLSWRAIHRLPCHRVKEVASVLYNWVVGARYV